HNLMQRVFAGYGELKVTPRPGRLAQKVMERLMGSPMRCPEVLVKNAAFGGLQLESLFMNDNGGILERERSFLLQTYNRYPVVLARGKGVFLYDLEGQRYLD